MTRTMTRANRVAVQSIEGIYRADFYRTHKKVATMMSNEAGWEADESMNKSAQREDFRKFAIEHAGDIGIEWNPSDMRSASNVRMPKYTDDATLKVDAEMMLTGDILQLINKCPHGITYTGHEVDCITPVMVSAKGTDLSKLGILDGKYEKSGNWAWADMEVLVTMTKDGQTIYYTTTMQLVSGQLKKPHITQTSFNESIKESLKEVGLWVEESKEDKKSKDTTEDVQEPKEESKEESKEEVKPRRSRKSKKETATA